MNTITTLSGIELDPFDPKPHQINLSDVATALSMQCRFNGHVNRFYSVAEHSVLVSRLAGDLADEAGVKGLALTWIKMAGLLHDAGEAYLGDIVTPVKDRLMCLAPSQWDAQGAIGMAYLDAYVTNQVANALVGEPPNRLHTLLQETCDAQQAWDIVHKADKDAYMLENAILRGIGDGVIDDQSPTDLFMDVMLGRVPGLDPIEARTLFLARFNGLNTALRRHAKIDYVDIQNDPAVRLGGGL